VAAHKNIKFSSEELKKIDQILSAA
jgi:hypothetical protein